MTKEPVPKAKVGELYKHTHGVTTRLVTKIHEGLVLYKSSEFENEIFSSTYEQWNRWVESLEKEP